MDWTLIGSLASGAIGGAVIGAIITPLLDNSFQTRRIIKEQKMQALKDLMATRFDSPLDQNAPKTINFIPVLFADNANAIKAYENYHDAYINSANDRVYKYNSLIVEIAKDVGIGFKPLDLMRVPIFSKQQVTDAYKCNEEYNLLKLKAKYKSNHDQTHY